MKKKIKILIGMCIISTCFICFFTWFLLKADSTYYYTQIDNSKIEQVNSRKGVIDFQGGMNYSYTLPAYTENGNEKNITFGTSRELKEGAFIRLTVMPIRGVIEWNEMQYNELPMTIQKNYSSSLEI